MKLLLLVAMAPIAFFGLHTQANAQVLGTAGNFAVLAGTTVTNTGPSILNGDLGVYSGTAITGFGPGIVVPPGTIHEGDAVALQAQNDTTTAYNALAGLPATRDLTGQDLGGLTLVPGVYFFSSSAQLTGTLTLDAQGLSDPQFVFQIGSTLTTASNSSVVMTNTIGKDCNVYWQVGSSATLGTGTAFEGHILALTTITANTGATDLDGSFLARTGAVNLDSNTISTCETSGAAPVPEPASWAAFAFMGLGGAGLLLRKRCTAASGMS